MIIYKATNLINGKVYIGQTIKPLNRRKIEHFSSAKTNNKTYFWKALSKYGIDNFKWQVICICSNIDSLNEQEEYYIKFYDSMNVGYNLMSGGNNGFHSEITKKKMSKKHSGKNNPMYGKKSAMKGKRFSKEARKNMSESQQGEKHWNYGKHRSEETKRKIGNALQGRVLAKLSEEHKRKISYSVRKFHTNE